MNSPNATQTPAPTWPICITDLEAAGWSLVRIGASIGLSPQALSDVKQSRSKDPRGMPAVRLFMLHRRICGVDVATSTLSAELDLAGSSS